jgi:hypothetical protein
MKTIRTLALLTFAISASALASGCIIVSDDDDSTITIVNDSDFFLVDIAIALEGFDYGPNLLNSALPPGGEVTIFDVECDFYDIRIEDEDGFVCELLSVDICFEDAVFFIDNVDLNSCGTFALRDQSADKQSKPTETKKQ